MSPYKTNGYAPGESSNQTHMSYTSASASYSISSGNAAAFQKRGSKRFLIFLLVVIVVISVAAWFSTYPPFYDITINGSTVRVSADTTLRQVMEDGHAAARPGNLLAVDESILEFGGGTPFSATINDEAIDDLDTVIPPDAFVTISDGADIIEEYVEETERVPFGLSSIIPTPDNYFEGSVHLYSRGVDGVRTVRTGAISNKTTTSIQSYPVDKGYTVYTPDVGDDKVVALTFDDGPWPETTEQILDILQENDAHATFFVIGEQCAENAETLKRIVDSGNQVATHTYDHGTIDYEEVDFSDLDPEDQVDEVNLGFKAIEDVLEYDVSRILRTPGGNYYGDTVNTLEPYVVAEIGWDVDTRDWEMPGVASIVELMLEAKPGDIILMHDGGGDRSQTVEALRIALPLMKKDGYSFVTVDDILAYGVPGHKENS